MKIAGNRTCLFGESDALTAYELNYFEENHRASPSNTFVFVLHAIELCHKHNLQLPAWVASAVRDALTRADSLSDNHKTWTQVLGKLHEKRKFQEIRNFRSLAQETVIRVLDEHVVNGRGICDSLMDAVGQKVGLSRERVYEAWALRSFWVTMLDDKIEEATPP